MNQYGEELLMMFYDFIMMKELVILKTSKKKSLAKKARNKLSNHKG